jgi:hypothetical protein
MLPVMPWPMPLSLVQMHQLLLPLPLEELAGINRYVKA